MTTVIKEKNQLVVPDSVRRRARLKAGDQVEFRAIPGVITKPPAVANDEYTPEQRRIIDSRLEKADEDIKAGRVYGPFDTIAELERSMRRVAKDIKGKSKIRAR